MLKKTKNNCHEKHEEHVKSETLATKLSFTEAPSGASVVKDAFEGETVKVGLVKNQ